MRSPVRQAGADQGQRRSPSEPPRRLPIRASARSIPAVARLRSCRRLPARQGHSARLPVLFHWRHAHLRLVPPHARRPSGGCWPSATSLWQPFADRPTLPSSCWPRLSIPLNPEAVASRKAPTKKMAAHSAVNSRDRSSSWVKSSHPKAAAYSAFAKTSSLDNASRCCMRSARSSDDVTPKGSSKQRRRRSLSFWRLRHWAASPEGPEMSSTAMPGSLIFKCPSPRATAVSPATRRIIPAGSPATTSPLRSLSASMSMRNGSDATRTLAWSNSQVPPPEWRATPQGRGRSMIRAYSPVQSGVRRQPGPAAPDPSTCRGFY